MSRSALAFYFLAVIAALAGFSGAADMSTGIAKLVFLLSIMGFLTSLILHIRRV